MDIEKLISVDTAKYGEPLVWTSKESTWAELLFPLLEARGAVAIWRWLAETEPHDWTPYSVADGYPIPGSKNFKIETGDVIFVVKG